MKLCRRVYQPTSTRRRPLVEGGGRLFVKGRRRLFARRGRLLRERPFIERGRLLREAVCRGRKPFVERRPFFKGEEAVCREAVCQGRRLFVEGEGRPFVECRRRPFIERGHSSRPFVERRPFFEGGRRPFVERPFVERGGR